MGGRLQRSVLTEATTASQPSNHRYAVLILMSVASLSTCADDAKPWSQKDCQERAISSTMVTLKLIAAFAALFLFICSLSFLADGFRLVAGKKAGEVFQNSEVFNNPVAGVMVGVLVTVLVQSSVSGAPPVALAQPPPVRSLRVRVSSAAVLTPFTGSWICSRSLRRPRSASRWSGPTC